MADPSKVDAAQRGAARNVTIIGSNVVVEDGRIVVVDDLVVYGLVDADVVAGGKVNIAQGGRVVGRIEAESVSISGLVRGEVDTRDTFRLEETGELYGRAVAKRFVVAPGSAGEFQLKMLRDESMPAATSVHESRKRYEAVLKRLSEMTGAEYQPSEGYLSWFNKQRERTLSTDPDEADVWSREPELDVSNREPVAGETRDDQIVIDWPRATDEQRKTRERFAGKSDVGRAAWSKSVGDEVGRKNSEHFALSAEEIILVSEGLESKTEQKEGATTDELLDSDELRQSVEEMQLRGGKGGKESGKA